MEELLIYTDGNNQQWKIEVDEGFYTLRHKTAKAKKFTKIKETRKIEELFDLIPGHKHLGTTKE